MIQLPAGTKIWLAAGKTDRPTCAAEGEKVSLCASFFLGALADSFGQKFEISRHPFGLRLRGGVAASLKCSLGFTLVLDLGRRDRGARPKRIKSIGEA